MVWLRNLESELQKSILKWYNFKKNTNVLFVGDNENLVELFRGQNFRITHVSVRESAKTDFIEDNRAYFDYIVTIGILETCYEPVEMLKRWRSMLKSSGHFLLGTDNRLGLRYFCGDRDPFTGHNFDGIEDYRAYDSGNIKAMGGRCYDRYQIEIMLGEAGFSKRKFYSVLPNLSRTQLVYAEDYLPNEELAMRYFPAYHYPDTVFLHEEQLYTSLVRNGLFHQMANSYLIECSDQKDFSDVVHVTLSIDRGPEQAFATIIRSGRRVEKYPLYPQGRKKLRQLLDNAMDLKEHGISVVDAEIRDGVYCMPYISAPVGNSYMQELLLYDKDGFIEQMDRFYEIILQSSEHVTENELGVILKRGYIDLVPLNCFYLDHEFVFYDQEFYEENYPAKAIMYRVITIIYDNDKTRESILPSVFFWERYHMRQHLSLWQNMTIQFTEQLRNQQELAFANDRCFANRHIIDFNRMKINESRGFYERLFRDNCFEAVKGKEIYVFGAGRYADKFLAFYKDELNISGVLDNNSSKWGLEFRGITVASPEILIQRDADSYKVIVCVKNYESVVKQLMRMGVQNIGIYDVNHIYPGRQRELPEIKLDSDQSKKKYHIGYIAGVFDLYHIGHLNMFRRAKEQCDYLIAAVVSDDGVRNNKKREPFIPFEERIEMVRSCKYVDEAVEIPYLYGGTVDAYQKYHFDCQFSGSDYIDDPWWLEQKKYLEEHGAELVFFPYTQQTSSTKIKALIERGLA